MKKMALLFLLFVFSCGVKQPIDNDNEFNSGKIFVTSNPVGCQIFLDGANTGNITPDTLFNVPIGWHLVQVIKDGFRSIPDSLKILVEANKVSLAQFELEKFLQFGYLNVATIPANGEIFIDEQTTGAFTPDTIQIETGSHQIQIRKNGYRTIEWQVDVLPDSSYLFQYTLEINQRVLLETFGNVSCTPCVDAATNLHHFIEQENGDHFAIIEYYANWPSPNDPFYKVSPQDVMRRLSYYQVSTLPTLEISGTQGADAANYDEIVSTFQNSYSTQNSDIGVSIQKNLIEGNLQVTVGLYRFDGVLSDDQLRLFVAVIENKIHYDSPPGSNGLTDFDFVFRKFLSSNDGDPIRCDLQQKEFVYTLQWPDWNYANCEVIAFIQNISFKQIIQSSKH